MPFLKVPVRRIGQPQDAVELSNAPLAKGILIALPLGGSRLNSVGSDRRVASAIGAGSGVSAKGVAAKFSGSDYISLGTVPMLASTTPCAFSIYEESFGTNPYASLLGLTASGSSNQFLFLRGSDPAYGCALSPANSATNARTFSGIGVQTVGEKIRFFVTCANGLGTFTGIRVWANGVELSSGTCYFGPAPAGTSYLGWDGYEHKFNGLLSDFVLWGRVPSDAEIKAYFDSPGQIYTPTSRRLWISEGLKRTIPGAVGNATADGVQATVTTTIVVIKAGHGYARVTLAPKRLGDPYRLVVDFISQLDPGDSVVSCESELETYWGADSVPTLAYSTSPLCTGTKVVQYLAGGQVGSTYKLSLTAHTPSNETAKLTAFLAVTE